MGRGSRADICSIKYELCREVPLWAVVAGTAAMVSAGHTRTLKSWPNIWTELAQHLGRAAHFLATSLSHFLSICSPVFLMQKQKFLCSVVTSSSWACNISHCLLKASATLTKGCVKQGWGWDICVNSSLLRLAHSSLDQPFNKNSKWLHYHAGIYNGKRNLKYQASIFVYF